MADDNEDLDKRVEKDYKIIKESLDPETQKKIGDQVGRELQKVWKTYEEEIRDSKKISDVNKFTDDFREAVTNVLKKHLKLDKVEGGIGALADNLTDNILKQQFRYDAEQMKQMYEGLQIDDYDQTAFSSIRASKDSAKNSLSNYGFGKIDGHMKSLETRGKFFERASKDLGGSYEFTDHAKKESIDSQTVTEVLSSAFGKALNEDYAVNRSKGHLKYIAPEEYKRAA